MDDVILKGIGNLLLTVADGLFVFLAFLLARQVNGISDEFYVLITVCLVALSVFIHLVIKQMFKISENDYVQSLIID